MDIKKILADFANCPCGKSHALDDIHIEIGEGLLAKLPEILAKTLVQPGSRYNETPVVLHVSCDDMFVEFSALLEQSANKKSRKKVMEYLMKINNNINTKSIL